ncbi:MAG: site-2 protease family protein [Burkholderiales bacterium]
MELSLIQKIAVFALPVLFAITLHEAAHGYVAKHFGDMTAYAAGRVSLNPLRHIDLVGTIIVPLISLLLTSFMFGWAKPVPVNFGNLHHPKRDMLWVAAAGPLSNLFMALVWALLLSIGARLAPDNPAAAWMVLVGAAGVFVNVIFFVLNLFPLPPLDGGRIAVSLLPHNLAWKFAKIERFGFMILLVLLFTGVLGKLLSPLITLSLSGIAAIFGIPEQGLYHLLRFLHLVGPA